MPFSLRGKTLLDATLLALSAAALPLSWFLLRKSGRRRSALAVTGACAVLFTRDFTMVLASAPRRLRPMMRVLLFVELATSGIAVATGARASLPSAPGAAAVTARQGGLANGPCSPKRLQANMIAAKITFFLHTIRQAIYIGFGHMGVPQGSPRSR